MKTRTLVLSLIVGLVHAPNPVRAERIPEKYRDTLKKGLDYLVKQQHADGKWDREGKQSVELTALAGLALRMQGWYKDVDIILEDKDYSGPVAKAVDWLLARSQPSGLIYAGPAADASRYMEGHGLATLFLASVPRHRVGGDKRDEVLAQAVKYIVKGQSSLGGWYHTSAVEGHDFAALLPTAVQVQALEAAQYAGIAVPEDSIVDGVQYLTAALDKLDRAAKADGNGQRLLGTAAALACRYSARRPQNLARDPLLRKRLDLCDGEFAKGVGKQLGREDLAHFYYAQVLHHFGGESWNGYRTTLFGLLLEKQNKDGSFPAGNGFVDGPLGATALWCVVMQLDHRNFPTSISHKR